ncbi:MerR family transcriptional regulator [Thiohalorhabdus sp.]|uniref:MerR family transcriptional regulator n=1 Tax=Thiohalorhabdus sp. TaxID=3094134 RepID=UPI002FC368BC
MGIEDPLPNKRYFGIRQVAELCEVAPHVLRYWEEEFPDLAPLRRGGNRRYYRATDVHLVRRIRYLLKDCKYTIEGAREQLAGGTDRTGPVEELREVRRELAAIRDQLDGPPAGRKP